MNFLHPRLREIFCGTIESPQPSTITSRTALQEGNKNWQAHHCTHISLFNDGRVFAPFRSDGSLIKDLHWQKYPDIDLQNYIRHERYYRCKKLNGTLLSLYAPNSTANYYHWLMDVLPRLHLFHKAFPDVVPDFYLFSGPMDISYKKQTLDLLKIPPKKRVGNSHWHHLSCREVYITDKPQFAHVPEPWTCRLLRDTFLPFLQNNTPLPERIYISRNDSKVGRKILNQDRLLAMLETFNIKPVVLSDLSFVEQLSLFARAELVIAPHGAGMANLVFCRPGTPVVEIFNSNFSKRCFTAIGEACHLNYIRMEQIPCEPDQEPIKANVMVDIPALQNKIASLLSP